MKQPIAFSLFFCLLLSACGDSSNSSSNSGSEMGKSMANSMVDSSAYDESFTQMSDSDHPIASPEEVAALYDMLQSGANISLKNKIYYLDRPLLIEDKKDISLNGNGSQFIMRKGDEDVVLITSGNNIRLKGFTATHLEADGPLGCTGNVIHLENSNDILIERCQLNGSGIIGVVAYNCKNLRIAANYIHNNSRYGILFDKDCSLQVMNNQFENNGPSGDNHVAKTLDILLNEIEDITSEQKYPNLTMVSNIFKKSNKPKDAESIQQQDASPEQVLDLYAKLGSDGDVKLDNLIYHLSRPIIISGKENFTLDGNGSTFIMKNKSEDVIIVENSTKVNLRNFVATHIEPDGPLGCTGSVISVNSSVDVTIEKCGLNGSGIIGVVSYGNKNLRITDNYIYNNSRYGVLFDKDSELTIINNTFEDNGPDGNDHIAKALNASLSEVEKIEAETSNDVVNVSSNSYQ